MSKYSQNFPPFLPLHYYPSFNCVKNINQKQPIYIDLCITQKLDYILHPSNGSCKCKKKCKGSLYNFLY